MRRETKPCPFYGMPCEYVPMAEKSDAQAAEIERLRAALRALHDEMDEYQRINNLSAYNNQVMRQARTALEGK